MAFHQPQPDPPCLRFPENIGLHASVTVEAAVNMLSRATQLSLTVPYTWSYIDKPVEGSVILIFLPNPAQFPNDGIRYQDQETRYTVPAPGNRELEVMEVKYGFIPNSQENSAWRLRRRYRLVKGGHPQITLMHYTRGPPMQIVPSLLNSPVRQYPLRQITEPPVYIMGDKAGQKVYPPGAGPAPPPGPMGMSPQGMAMGQAGMGMAQQGMGMAQQGMGMAQQGMGMAQQGMGMAQQGMSGPQTMAMSPQAMALNPQTMLAQQNSNMEALERRRERERARERSGSMGAQRPGPPRLDDDDSGDEFEMISTRTLAMTRYKRNHELMEEVFKRAAFGNITTPPPRAAPYSIFDKAELDSKVAKLEEEIAALQAQAEERKARRSAVDDVIVATGHTPMEVSS